MHNQHKLNRVLNLIRLLQTPPPKLIRTLAQAMGSTERTVYRYMDLLENSGYEVQKDNRKRFYLKQVQPEVMFLPLFSVEEADFLVSLLNNLEYSALRDSLLSKLLTIEELGQHVGVDPDTVRQYGITELLQKGLKNQQVLEIQTRKGGQYRILPLRFSDNLNFVVGYDFTLNDWVSLEIRQIDKGNLSLDQEMFSIDSEVPAVDCLGQIDRGRVFNVEIEFEKPVLADFRTLFPFAVQQLRENGIGFTFNAKVFESSLLAEFVLLHIKSVRVLQDENFRLEIRQRLQKILETYYPHHSPETQNSTAY